MVFQTVSYMAERVVGTGSFGVVFQVCRIICDGPAYAVEKFCFSVFFLIF